MKGQSPLFASIIPILRLTPELNTFDYRIPEFLQKTIRIGHIVYIPFRRKMVLGIVCALCDQEPLIKQSIKEINRLYTPEIILPLSFVLFLQKASTYYHTSPSLLAYNVLPSFPKQQRTVSTHKAQKTHSKLVIKKDRIFALSQASETLSLSSGSLLLYQLEQEVLSLLIKEIQKTIQEKKQVLFLLPYVSDIYRLLPFLNQYIPARIAIIHKKMSKGEYFQIWKSVAEQKVDIVIGTRLAIFSPCDHIGLVVIHNEEYVDFKQYEMNPRYDARTLALIQSKESKTKIIFTSQAPRIQTWHQAKKSEITLIEIPRILVDTTVIDLSAQIRQRHYSLLTQPVIDALEEHPISFLYLNKKGIDQGTFCKDCHHILNCIICDTIFKKEDSYLFCPKCFIKKDIPTQCPKCHGQNLISLGTGTKKMQKELKKLFPDRPIFRFDKEGDIFPSTLPPSCIMIGTEFAIKNYWNKIAPHISLICALELDVHGSLFDYKYGEKQFATIMHLLNLSIASHSTFLVQSHHIHNELLQNVLQQNMKEFYTKELKHRKTSDYPPFSHLCKIICKDTQKNQQEKHIQELIDKLTSDEKNGNLEYIGDYELTATNKYIRHAIIFKTHDIFVEFPPLPEHYQLDIDYETV